MRWTLPTAGALAQGFAMVLAMGFAFGLAASPALADDSADIAYAKRMLAGNAPKAKAYACFVRRYDAQHMAAHPKQKVTAMKLLITAEMVPEDTVLNYSFRLGVAFRDRPGDFDSSGDCGHTATARAPDDAAPAEGVDFDCSVDCDGGGISVKLANNDGALIVKPLDAIRIWKGKDPDVAAAIELRAGADDKIFRLDRAQKPDECAALVTDRKELAALRHK